MHETTILIPTKDRPMALAATLTSIAMQQYKDFSIIVADQSTNNNLFSFPTIQTLQRLFFLHKTPIYFLKNLPPKGMAQQRQFLLEKVTTPYCLFLDDDCILEPYVIKNLVRVIKEKKCGFVGQAVIGLSYLDDVRPSEQIIELWENEIQPETIRPRSKKWKRYSLHNAANILHIQKKLHTDPLHPQTYKVAWVGGCVVYDTEKLKKVGGFSFWKDLPKEHAGEDVLAQLKVMEKYGGCGILPSGVYHQELPTTIPNREVNAPEFLK